MSNDQLKQSINQEISNLIDRANKVIYQFKGALDREFNANMEKVGEETKKTLEELESIKDKANERFTSYYNRKKWIDYMIWAYIAATPILFGVVIWLFIKE